MKISEQWLAEWVPAGLDTQTLAHRLTMAGLEVDGIEPAAPAFSDVVVGEIIDCAPHPDADKLSLCRVNDGTGEPLQVVCGAPNARAGLRAPFARVGGELPDGMRIKRAKLRGQESFGMLCSARELGLSEDAAGLLELPADAPVGQDLRQWLQLDDQVIEVDLTPNRGDCLGMIGVAREVSALTGVDMRAAEVAQVAAEVDDTVGVDLRDPLACPRYVGRVIRGVDVTAATPFWMQERLRRAGVRSLGPVVDVTNYVMLELGQPMHAFDLAKIHEGIVVRQAEAGETLTLLGDETVELQAGTLVIADHRGPLAMAGVMGGAPSSVTDHTTDILFESAFFAPEAMAGRARAYGLHTDSSHRFERGVDPAGQVRAVERATSLLTDIAGGRPGPVVDEQVSSEVPTERTVTLRSGRVRELLGVDIPAAEVADILQRLGMSLVDSGGGWQVSVPAYRFDIDIEADLIEELARVHGYDRIPETRPATPTLIQPQPEERVALARLRSALVDRGFQETVTYSFVEPGLQHLMDPDHEPVPLANPISAELAVMRTSLWPGLARAAVHNRHRQHQRLRLFETGLRFRGSLDQLEQQPMLGAMVMGPVQPEQWGEPARAVDFFDLKGDLEAVLALTGRPEAFSFVADRHPALHPGQSARIELDGEAVGWLGALHPDVQRKLDMDEPAYVFEMTLEAAQQARLPAFAPLSRFPSIRRDLAVVVAESVSAAALEQCVRRATGDWLQGVALFDVYQGKGVADGFKSVGIGLILQDFSRTLTDSDVDEVISGVVVALRGELDAELRG
ncbi:phenylalanine--tRNA ligase subunit beta [Aquisalimonas sp. 2447]|uniref:phenylalanine--tRNA ligase subunit beta n=1 Tax=Aquisalimonas sp. 2447 TaxID=2740807 RepID=UPI00143251A3|nr:phenylalanine--tRNA ligase subunit beta [Aquisalimonas sp. 2447]QIT56112.1 phenylalanine--tRNA ligase subunit beta [Aquisalimonas sp. 2447]